MDTRGQGWNAGGYAATPDDAAQAGLNHAPGFMTSGLEDPDHYYYRRVYVDTIRCLEAARSNPLIDNDKIIVAGGSQGGGLSIAAAGLAPYAGIEVIGCAPDVPFLCHFQRALKITGNNPYGEITNYLHGWRDQVEVAYRTLSYFDAVNLGRRATAAGLFSVALMDATCPPSTVFAAYNFFSERAGAQKSINVYSHNQHEGGGDYQMQAKLEWIAEQFG